MIRSLFCVSLLLLLPATILLSQKKPPVVAQPVLKSSTSNDIKINFGKNGQIIYHLNNGTADIFSAGNLIIKGAYASFKDGPLIINSTAYHSGKYAAQTFSDGIGKGTRHTITLQGDGLPVLVQSFYTYITTDYFFTEILVKKPGLVTNFMAPLIASDVNIVAAGDNRILFVPFDNDTFISYNAKSMSDSVSNTSSEVGVFYEDKSRNGLVTGSVEHMVWKTGVKTKGMGNRLSQLCVWGGYTEQSVTRDTIPHGYLNGDSIKSPKIFVGYFSDWRNGLEAYGRANRKLEKPYVFNWTKPTPLGWNSWGVLQDHITYEKVTAVADFFKDSLPAFRNGNTAFIDLDSYWDKFLQNGINGDLSILKKFADHCKATGLEPGVYWAPFTDWGWNYEGSGARKVEGSDRYTFSDIWTKTGGHYHNIDGARAIDPTHPGTQQRVALFISKLKACGFKMIKIDFLGHAAVEADSFYDSTVTTGMQAYRKGMEFLVDQLGGQMLIYAAISPSLATGRYVHVRRIACDAFKAINDTRYTLNSVNYGWWQTFIYNYIDADHIVFGDESMGSNRARLASGLITGTLITGDDYSRKGAWSSRAIDMLQNPELLLLVKNGIAFEPVNGNSGDKTNPFFQRRIGNDMYVAVFNFTDHDTTYKLDPARIGIPVTTKGYTVMEIFNQNNVEMKDSLHIELAKHDAAIYKIRL